jgi:pimeloyl-ACP methyl ester carboxylesterase
MVRENGAWRLDLVPLMAGANAYFKKAAAESGMSEDDFVLMILERMSDRPVSRRSGIRPSEPPSRLVFLPGDTTVTSIAMASPGSTPIGYDDRGTGPVTVLLHPFPLTRTTWAGLADALAVHRRVIAVDARGFGESPLTGPFAIADIADDVAALLDRLSITRATLVGMSMGGYAALAFAARHRDRLSALVLADTRAAADSAETRAGRAAALAALADAGPAAYLAASLPRLLSPHAPPALAAHVRARAETRAANLRAGIEALRDRPDRSGELGAIACPTLVVCGTDDQVTPAAEMQQMAAAIAGARFVPIAGAGTCPTSNRRARSSTPSRRSDGAGSSS